MNKSLFYKKDIHKQWDAKLEALRPLFEQHAARIDTAGEFPTENLNKLREIGYTKLTLPVQYGGAGYMVYDAVLAQEKLGSLDGSTALVAAWTLLTVGELYEYRYWKHDSLEQYARKVAAGAVTNRAVSEFAMGSPMRGGKVGSTASRQVDGWLLNGRKNYTTGSYGLDDFLVAVWVEEQEQMGYFLIPKETQGMTIEENWDVLSMRGTASHDLVLDNVKLPADALVELAQDRALVTQPGWQLLIPATYLGIAQAARDYAIQFAKTHAPNSINGTISELPNVRALIAEIDVALASARFALYGTAECYDDKERRLHMTTELGIAKHLVTNTAIQVVDKAMRLVGAKSLQNSCPLQRYYRDVRAGLHNPPMDEVTMMRVATEALK